MLVLNKRKLSGEHVSRLSSIVISIQSNSSYVNVKDVYQIKYCILEFKAICLFYSCSYNAYLTLNDQKIFSSL